MAKHLNPLEKEFLIRRYRSNQRISIKDFCESNGITDSSLKKWMKQYDEGGLEGLARADADIKEVLPEGVDRTEESYKREILKLRIQIPTFYHSSNESECEIDFAVQTEKRVIPIEAKAEENVKGKSLKTYIDEHPALKGLRVSMKNYIDQGWMENLPLYAIEGYLRAEGIPVPEQGE